MTEVSCIFPVFPHKSQDISSNEVTTISFHILCNSFYNTTLSFDCKQSGLLTALLDLWAILPHIDSIRFLPTEVLPEIYDLKAPAQAVLSPRIDTQVLIFDTNNQTTNLSPDGQKKNSQVNRLHKPQINKTEIKLASPIWNTDYECRLQWIANITFPPPANDPSVWYMLKFPQIAQYIALSG